MKKVIYTCLTGEYDNLLDPKVVSRDFDYICFTDNLKAHNSSVWRFVKIPYESSNKRVLSRYVKLMPHKALPEYDYSLWIDANIVIEDNTFYDIINNLILSNCKIGQVSHNRYSCLYKEIRHAYKIGKVGFGEAKSQYDFLEGIGFPRGYGFYENNVILRLHNDPFVVSISEEWWSEYLQHKNRDQFSLVYIYWKNNCFHPELLFGEGNNSRNVKCLSYHKHPPHPKIGGYVTIKNTVLRVCHHIIHFITAPLLVKYFK